MKSSILWLAHLGLEQGLFSLAGAQAVRRKLGEGAELLDFAQELLDAAHVPEAMMEQLERVAGLAQVKGREGPPAFDPFSPPPVLAAPPPRAPEARRPALALHRSSSTPSIVSAPLAGLAAAVNGEQKPRPVARTIEMPRELADFSFDRLGVLDDEALAQMLRALLCACAREGASDLHLCAGSAPFIRRQRQLRPLGAHLLTPEEALRLNTVLLAPHQRAQFLEHKDLDLALALPGGERYRVNLLVHKGGPAGAYRIVANEIPRLERLGLRHLDSIRKLLSYHNGLILVTGPVGAGKTTTLAALVAELNETRRDHIITVEDPIEVVQVSRGCNVTQREVGAHTRSFASALKGALREDPDVIVIGELRDLETIEMAVSASETGHLVIATMHTSDAATTLNRLLDVFPPAQQAQIRASVAESLRGVVCQRLLPGVGGGLVLATEVLIGTPAVAALIREGKMQGLRNILETGQREGMCLMESSVFKLYEEGAIAAETARAQIANRVLRARIV